MLVGKGGVLDLTGAKAIDADCRGVPFLSVGEWPLQDSNGSHAKVQLKSPERTGVLWRLVTVTRGDGIMAVGECPVYFEWWRAGRAAPLRRHICCPERRNV